MKQEEILPYIIAARTGDKKAEEKLFNITSDEVFQRIKKDASLSYEFKKKYAEDIRQDVLRKIYLNLEKYNPEAGAYSTWINAILKYTKIDYINKHTAGDIITEVTPGRYSNDIILKSVSFKTLRNELYKLVYKAISNEKYRTALLLFLQVPPKQHVWARALGIKAGTFRTHIERGGKKLKEYLHRNPDSMEIIENIRSFADEDYFLLLTPEDLSLISGKKRKAIETAKVSDNLSEILRTMNMTDLEYYAFLQEALSELMEKMYKRRKASAKRKSKKDDSEIKDTLEVIQKYLQPLFRYRDLSYTRSEEENISQSEYILKSIAEAFFYVFTAPNLPPQPGKLISEAVKDSELSREEVAESLGISIHEYASYISGKETLSKELIGKISSKLDIPKEELQLSVEYSSC